MTADLDRMLVQLRDRESAHQNLGDVEHLAWQRISEVECRQRRTMRVPLQVAAVAVAFVLGIWMGGQEASSPPPRSDAFLVEETDFLLVGTSRMHPSY